MASVFPDTSVNNPDTGSAWADGDIWNDPDSGLTYSWYNPVWKTGGAGAEGNFVLVAGDNMTGDLTLGTDKITLDATAGNATFAGAVSTDQYFNSNGGTVGYYHTNPVTNKVTMSVENNVVGIGDDITVGSAGLTSAIALKTDGSGTFAGDVLSGESTANGILIRGSDPAIKMSDTDSSNSEAYIGRTGAGTSAFQSFQLTDRSGTNTVNISGSGAATFAGNVKTVAAASAAGGYRHSQTDAGYYLQDDAGNSAIALYKDGNASFSDLVLTGAATNANQGTGSWMQSGGGIYTTRPAGSTDAAFTAFQQGGAASPTVMIRADGSAVFKGAVQTAGGVVTPSMVLELEADDDTKYTSTTDSEGEVTRVYNGAVLDVKERIQNVLARMDAMEANEITDDATDSSLLSLVASLTTRLDERDTAIAALTARVAALES